MRLNPFRSNAPKSRGFVFALDTAFLTLYVYPSRSAAVADIQGLEVAEGNWRFFDGDGLPLEARFSVPARINPESNTYSNGVYSLELGMGETLQAALPTISSVNSTDFFSVHDVADFLGRSKTVK